MERHELINGYLRSLQYYIWISDLSPVRKTELFEQYQLLIEEQSTSRSSLSELRSLFVDLGNPKDIVKKEMHGLEGSLTPTNGKFKRGMGFMPYILTISWTLNSDLYHQLSAWQFQTSFWLHTSIICILLIATISSFYKYRYDQSFFKEIVFSNFVVYLPLSFIFCYMLLQQFSITALIIPFSLIALTTISAFYFDWRNSTFMRKLFIP
ncbi:hypothetical protein [Paenibacillus taiwanensis]|uniref:hypothetical protein n=1 Tax=Paenibacillus taiwanensis TaxID=401638 RepID=UPI000423EFB1|nr:hypothetical protein [Paenibacillus taiwanensis]